MSETTYGDIKRKTDCNDGVHMPAPLTGKCIFCGKPTTESSWIEAIRQFVKETKLP